MVQNATWIYLGTMQVLMCLSNKLRFRNIVTFAAEAESSKAVTLHTN